MKPRARTEGLVVKELDGEVLVYDLKRHQAHCLNPTAALVFRSCDGQTSVKEIARHLHSKLKAPADERLVWLALDRLGRARLLEERTSPPPELVRCSRREWMRKVGLVGGLTVLLPLVTSIVAPTPAEAAATCVASCAGQPFGTPCSSTAPANCFCTCDGLGACVGGC